MAVAGKIAHTHNNGTKSLTFYTKFKPCETQNVHLSKHVKKI